MRYRFMSYHLADDDAEREVTEGGGTRLGGQPVWVEEPQWPVSPYEDEPSSFMG